MKQDKAYNYNWLHFSQAYLKAAKAGCEEFIRIEDSGAWEYTDLWLVIPIFYNAKHGIEIFIKTISIFIEGDYNGKSHNIHELFKDLKLKIKKLNIRACQDKKGNKITQKDITNFPKNIDNLENLIKEFYEVEILKSKINGSSTTIEDKMNDLFRYPDSKAITVNWENIIDRFSKKEMLKIEKNIEKLESLFNKVGYITTCVIQS